MGLDDVREALKSYEGEHIPREFARRETLMRAELARRRRMESGGKGGKTGVAALLGRGGGGGGTGPAPANDKMIFDLIREEGMRRYRAMEKEIRENGEKWLREEAEMMKKLEESSAKDMKKSFVGSLTKWVPFSDGDGETEEPKAESEMK
jgi:mitochondrial import inner membrane translocase subunit TIM50